MLLADRLRIIYESRATVHIPHYFVSPILALVVLLSTIALLLLCFFVSTLLLYIVYHNLSLSQYVLNAATICVASDCAYSSLFCVCDPSSL